MSSMEEIFYNSILPWLKVEGVGILIILISVFLVKRFGHMVIEKIVRRSVHREAFGTDEDEKAREDTLIQILDGFIGVLVWVMAVMMILASLGANIAPLLAGAGLVGVAVGFGAQYIVRDLITGLFIILENQYRVGDVVCLDGTCGSVERVTLRTTVLRDLDGEVHHVPNGEIKRTTNKSMYWSRVNLVVGVSYEADLDKVERVINEIGQSLVDDPEWKDKIIETPKFLRVNKLNDSSVDIRILGMTASDQQWAVTGELRRRIKNTFDKEGIEIPYPQRVIHTKK
ncbi:mechanosensitive ion channel family protein [Candidatus Parcubacteria bacterium]|nr:mechanosensitive ion channel family protein [Candidatus Parcubacteria bacterium]